MVSSIDATVTFALALTVELGPEVAFLEAIVKFLIEIAYKNQCFPLMSSSSLSSMFNTGNKNSFVQRD